MNKIKRQYREPALNDGENDMNVKTAVEDKEKTH